MNILPVMNVYCMECGKYTIHHGKYCQDPGHIYTWIRTSNNTVDGANSGIEYKGKQNE
jgi:hypothetical protein